jgi:hypothetical protein
MSLNIRDPEKTGSDGSEEESYKPEKQQAEALTHEGNGWEPDSNNFSAQNTFHEWLDVSTYYIELLATATEYLRFALRCNAAIGILLSTLSGTISVAQFNNYGNFVFSVLLTGMTYIVAISSGLMKILQIQEQLEEFIKLRQEWIDFSINIITEIQVPYYMRKPADYLIHKYKDKYTSLLKKDISIPDWIRKKVKTPLVFDGMDNMRRLESGKLASILSYVNNSKRPAQRREDIQDFVTEHEKKVRILHRLKEFFTYAEPKQPSSVPPPLPKLPDSPIVAPRLSIVPNFQATPCPSPPRTPVPVRSSIGDVSLKRTNSFDSQYNTKN